MAQVKTALIMILTLGVISTVGCSDDAQTAQTLNPQNDEVNTNIDMTQPIDEAEIGIPDDPSKIIRKTVITIPLKLNMSNIMAAGGVIYDKNRINNFKPDTHQNYRIADSHLVIEDSQSNQHPLIIYLIPYKVTDTPTKLKFETYFTVNNIAINTLNWNQSHTAFYLRGSYLGEDERHSSKVWNQDKMAMNGADPVTKWVAGAVILDTSGGSTPDVSHSPTLTQYPCFDSRDLDAKPCDTYSPGDVNNLIKTHLTLQPIATMGYKHFDWYAYNFTHDELKDLAPSTTPLTKAQTDAAIQETIDKLVKQSSVAGSRDIGWYGLPIATRNQILRYHITEISFEVTNTSASGTDIEIDANSIKIDHYNMTNPPGTATTATNPTLTLSLTTASDSEN